MVAGLKFNPYTAFGTLDNEGDPTKVDYSAYENNTSVPITAGQYFQPIGTSGPLSPIMSRDRALEESSRLQTSLDNDGEDFIDFQDKLFKYIGGLNNLDEEERDEWKKKYASYLDENDEYADRLWKNQQFAEAFGKDRFYEIKDPELRDKMYEDVYTDQAIEQKFKYNNNIGLIRDLTPEGKRDLLKSGYKPEYQLQYDIDKMKDKNFFQLSGEEKADALAAGVKMGGNQGTFIGSIIGAGFGAGGVWPGMYIGGMIGILGGAVNTLIDPSDEKDFAAAQKAIKNQYLLDKVVADDNDRLKEYTKDTTNDYYAELLDAYHTGRLDKKTIDEMFAKIADKEVSDSGSSYYTAFKNTDEFQGLDTEDKLKYIAQTDAISTRYGLEKAEAVLDQDMQNYANEHQTALDWTKNTGQNIIVGGIANLANNVTALAALGIYLTYGEEGLANYLQGKTPDGTGKMPVALDAQYWNKVDQYNTMSPTYINEVDKNGGVSAYTNIERAGEEGEWNWAKFNHAIGMTKFAWSDLLKNLALGKLVQFAAVKAGGEFISPGVLSAESSAAAKIINSLGSKAVVGASSLGIDVAYGLQTFNDVLQENNRKLDGLIAEMANDEVEKRMSDPRTIAAIEKTIAEENAKRKAMAKENEPWIPVDEDKVYVDFYNRIKQEVIEESERKFAKDRQQAANDAANAYAIDATIEWLRMSTTNTLFKSYLFDKGTLRTLESNNPFVNTVYQDGKATLGKWATRKAAAKKIGSQIWGGFQSNYFDDVTVAMAKSFELQDYNNYLMEKYNPAAYGSVMDNFIDPFVASMVGMVDSYTDGRSLMDGVVGAIGAPITMSPNIIGMATFNETQRRNALSKQRDEQLGIKTLDYGLPEFFNSFINNPVLDAYVEARERTRNTQREAERANKMMKGNGYSFDSMADKIAALDKKAIASNGESILEAEDAKDGILFEVASELLEMKNNYALQNAEVDPSRAEWSKKKKFASAIMDGLKSVVDGITGLNIKQYARTQYDDAMQQIYDAATITEESESEEQAKRKQDLIDTFLGLAANREIANDPTLSEENKRNIAAERLQRNATTLLDIMNKMEKISDNLSKSKTAVYFPDIKKQLMLQYAMADRWKQRGDEIEEKYNPEGREIDDDFNKTTIAKYGNRNGYLKALESQKQKVESLEKEYDVAKKTRKLLNKEFQDLKSELNAAAIELEETRTKEALELEKRNFALMEREGSVFETKVTTDGKEETIEKDLDVIKAEDIMKLDANSRLRMLDPYHKNDYSAQQQKEIDKAWNSLTENGTPQETILTDLRDAAALKDRIDRNKISIDRMLKNPAAAWAFRQALIENRKRGIMDYFNDKIVNEAMAELIKLVGDNDALTETARGMSYSTLQAIQNRFTQEKAKTHRGEDFTDIVLEDVPNAINTVMEERKERLKETDGLLGYISKTDNINNITDDGSIRTTNKQSLTENDKNLINIVANFAAEKNIPIEDVFKDDTTAEQFEGYLAERNHSYINANSVATSENRVDYHGREYTKQLLENTINDYKKYKETHKEEDKPKIVTDNPRSVGAVEKKSRFESRREEEKEEKKPKKELFKENRRGTEKKNLSDQDNALIGYIDHSESNRKFKNQMVELIDKINNLPFSDNQQEIKQVISDLISDDYKNFSDFKETFIKELIKKGLAAEASTIRNWKPSSNTESNEADSKSIIDNVNRPIDELVSLDLDYIMTSEKMKTVKEYMEKHKVKGVLDFLSSLAKRNEKNNNFLRQFQIVFLYDANLASTVRQNMKDSGAEYIQDSSAPIVLAIVYRNESGDNKYENKYLKEHFNGDEGSIVKVKVGNGSMEVQPIGLLPGSENTRMDYIDTASKMTNIREAIKSRGEQLPPTQILMIPGTTSKMTANIQSIEVHTGYEDGIHQNVNGERNSVHMLFNENFDIPAERIVDTNDGEIEQYRKAETPDARRKTSLYNKIREKFVKNLFKETASNGKKFLKFAIHKGSRASWGATVYTKEISRTMSKIDPEQSIVKLLQVIIDPNTSNTEKNIAIMNLRNSNSRFTRLFDEFSKEDNRDKLEPITDDAGRLQEYDETLEKIAHAVEVIVGNNFDIALNPRFSARVEENEDSPLEGRIVVDVQLNDGRGANNMPIASLPIQFNEMPSENDIATFMTNLILDADGNVRTHTFNDAKQELVKWQVNYNDAENNSKEAKINLGELFDDGIFEMRENKLAYPANRVVVTMGNIMQKEMFPKVDEEKPTATDGAVPATVKSKDGRTLDPDTGTVLGKPNGTPGTDAPNAAQTVVLNALNEIINKSAEIGEPSKTSYNIFDKYWGRITSLKHAIVGSKSGKLNENNAWLLPGSLIGNSFDKFSRDSINKLFESMSTEEKLKFFKNYENSVARNYMEVYNSLMEFKARIRQRDGEVLVSTGKGIGTNQYNRGKIIISGELNAVSTKVDGRETVGKIRAAGTVDQLAVDEDGNIVMYDFKTHHSENFGKEEAKEKGYDVQLSLYAKFLEEELAKMGITNAAGEPVRVKEIRILPARVDYDTPIGVDNDGKAIKDGKKKYKSQKGSDQLLEADANSENYHEFRNANYRVEEDFIVDRLSDEDLDVALEKLSEEQKEAIYDAFTEQMRDDEEPPPSVDDITVSTVKEEKQNDVVKKYNLVEDEFADNEDDEIVYDDNESGEQNATTPPITSGAALETIDPDSSLSKEMEERIKKCRGQQ